MLRFIRSTLVVSWLERDFSDKMVNNVKFVSVVVREDIGDEDCKLIGVVRTTYSNICERLAGFSVLIS